MSGKSPRRSTKPPASAKAGAAGRAKPASTRTKKPAGSGGKAKPAPRKAASPAVAAAPGLTPSSPLHQKLPQGVTKAKPEVSLAFAVDLAKLAVADKCGNVVLLDVKGLSPVTDYLVLATGTSGRQMRSTADESIQLGKDSDFSPLSSSGLDSETWICVDFVDVLLHIFNEESRQYYDLESLWGDAKRIDFAA